MKLIDITWSVFETILATLIYLCINLIAVKMSEILQNLHEIVNISSEKEKCRACLNVDDNLTPISTHLEICDEEISITDLLMKCASVQVNLTKKPTKKHFS